MCRIIIYMRDDQTGDRRVDATRLAYGDVVEILEDGQPVGRLVEKRPDIFRVLDLPQISVAAAVPLMAEVAADVQARKLPRRRLWTCADPAALPAAADKSMASFVADHMRRTAVFAEPDAPLIEPLTMPNG